MVIGWSVLALSANGGVAALDNYGKGQDEERVSRWLGGNDGVGCWKNLTNDHRKSLEGMKEINHKIVQINDPRKDLEFAAFND
jgi:hypothetical protein